jgi:adenosylmethionine-8-amino-7-oxononanoate aminotransferase
VIQISPPLVAGQEEFDRIASVLGDVLAEAWAELEKGQGRGKALAQA